MRVVVSVLENVFGLFIAWTDRRISVGGRISRRLNSQCNQYWIKVVVKRISFKCTLFIT